jgi:hypothetical protein
MAKWIINSVAHTSGTADSPFAAAANFRLSYLASPDLTEHFAFAFGLKVDGGSIVT